jgi:hypothetical protein
MSLTTSTDIRSALATAATAIVAPPPHITPYHLLEESLAESRRYVRGYKSLVDGYRRINATLSPEDQIRFYCWFDRELCRRFPYYFLTTKCYTKNQVTRQYALIPKGYATWLTCYTFLTYPKRIIKKSRQLAQSWINIALFLWLANFYPMQDIGFRNITAELTGFGGSGPPDPEFTLGRFWLMYLNLPRHIRCVAKRQNREPTCVKFFHIDPERRMPATSTAYAISGNDEKAWRSRILSSVMLDEFSFMEYADEIYGAVLPFLDNGRLTCIYTPNGNCFAEQVWRDETEPGNAVTEQMQPREELYRVQDFWRGKVLEQVLADETDVPISTKRFACRVNRRNKMLSCWIGWPSNPTHGKEWYKNGPMTWPTWKRLQEMEGSETARKDGKPAWKIDYRHERMKLPVDTAYPVYVVWDFGGHAAVLMGQNARFSQPYPWIQTRMLAEIDSTPDLDLNTEELGNHWKNYVAVNFPAETRFIHIADVAGQQRDYEIKMNRIDTLRIRCGIIVSCSARLDRDKGVDEIASKIKEFVPLWRDGRPVLSSSGEQVLEPGFVVNSSACPVLTEGLHGNIQIDRKGTIRDKERDDPYVHVAGDCLRYFACWTIKMSEITGGLYKEPAQSTPPVVMTKTEYVRNVNKVLAQEREARIRAAIAQKKAAQIANQNAPLMRRRGPDYRNLV